MTKVIQQLQENGFALMRYPEDIRASVETSVSLWNVFLQLESIEKQRFITGDSIGAGYERRSKQGVAADADGKQTFDVSKSDHHGLRQVAQGSDAEAFVEAALELSEGLERYAAQIAREMGEELDHPVLSKTQPSDLDVAIRFLDYPSEVADGQTYGHPHVDQSGFTFHLYESAPGCEMLLPTTRQWQPMDVPSSEAAVFPAMQLQQMSGGEVKALWHRITATSETMHVGRQAIVCFTRFSHQPRYDKQRHGRLQERQEGSTYDLSATEFDELFVYP